MYASVKLVIGSLKNLFSSQQQQKYFKRGILAIDTWNFISIIYQLE